MPNSHTVVPLPPILSPPPSLPPPFSPSSSSANPLFFSSFYSLSSLSLGIVGIYVKRLELKSEGAWYAGRPGERTEPSFRGPEWSRIVRGSRCRERRGRRRMSFRAPKQQRFLGWNYAAEPKTVTVVNSVGPVDRIVGQTQPGTSVFPNWKTVRAGRSSRNSCHGEAGNRSGCRIARV